MSKLIPKDAHAMIIGAMKCGTSSLFNYLSSHPEICPSITKEPEFFSDMQSHGVNVTSYSELFNFDEAKHKYTLDGSTGYTKYPIEKDVPKKIFEYGISPKIIYIIRNPFERIQSHYSHMQRWSKWKPDILDKQLIDTCNYFLQLEQFKKYFSTSDILILDFDELKADPDSVLKKVYDFLDLSHDYFPNNYEIKNQTRPLSKADFIINKLESDKELLWIPKTLKHALTQTLQKLLPKKARKLTETEMKFLHNELKDSMLKLNDVYGFDVRKWGFND
ncbi:sulfotransferase family protein [Pseudoalteromonas umbrosa]|uniref:sulfotransferase family protein n=1 Tax=Pseudoalteromonas umbrosa TaxID=3048489 RepID=UPI0024C2D0FE|nr:sulfotransferase [Pseudoalteromonas sp. B95]MDK1288233.1 sulfotransferase [Pseudoalteromonas sp. B95]